MSDLANFKIIYNLFVKQVRDELVKGEFKELVKKKKYFDEKIYSNRISEIEWRELINVLKLILQKTNVTFLNFNNFEKVIKQIVKRDKAFKYAFKYELIGIQKFMSAKIRLSFLSRLSVVDCLRKLIEFLEVSDFKSYKSCLKKISEFYLRFKDKMISQLLNDYGNGVERKVNIAGILLGISFIFILEVFVNSKDCEINYNKYVSWIDSIESFEKVDKKAQEDYGVEFIGEYNYYNEEKLLNNILKNYYKDVKFLQKIGVKYVIISPFDFEENNEKFGKHGHYNSYYCSLMFNDLYNSNTNLDEMLKTRLHEITLAYIDFLRKTGNLIEFEKRWKAIGDGGFLLKSQKENFISDVSDLSELIGFKLLKGYNKIGKYKALDSVAFELCGDVKLQFDKNIGKLNSKIKLLCRFGFIPKHIRWNKSSEFDDGKILN
jgi:hypothetical protein